GRPPLLCQLASTSHIERLGEAAGGRYDVNELRQHLRGGGGPVACSQQSGERSTCGRIVGVLRDRRRHEKTGVKSMHHGRPSSISSSRSSSALSGRSTRPSFAGGMSKRPCGADPCIDGAAGTVARATTVTSSPSGRRTPCSSTTTPFFTRPRAT